MSSVSEADGTVQVCVELTLPAGEETLGGPFTLAVVISGGKN